MATKIYEIIGWVKWPQFKISKATKTSVVQLNKTVLPAAISLFSRTGLGFIDFTFIFEGSMGANKSSSYSASIVEIGKMVCSKDAFPCAMIFAIDLDGLAAKICPKHCIIAVTRSLRHYSGTCFVIIKQISSSCKCSIGCLVPTCKSKPIWGTFVARYRKV